MVQVGKNQCYNHMCSVGIISVRSDFPPGLVRGPPCVRGSKTGTYDMYGLFKVCELFVFPFSYEIVILIIYSYKL